MKSSQYTILCCFLSVVISISCSESQNGVPGGAVISDDFKNYWYSGKAEVSSYNLIQERYGEERKGNAMMIFVTEDFSKNKQVKLDNPDNAGADKVSVLKLNMTKNFVTGIYPYSMMLSSFTPVDGNNTLKLTMSSQEWCGQSYSQVNLRHRNYEITNHSYFEKESDDGQNLKVTWLEDELWNRIRLNPQGLPVGELDMIPGLFFSRLNHVDMNIQKAICSKEEAADHITYRITFPIHQRSIAIEFEKVFPHRIKGWMEKQEKNGKTFTTTASLDKQIITDYWTKNKNAFLYLRDSLGLSRQNY